MRNLSIWLLSWALLLVIQPAYAAGWQVGGVLTETTHVRDLLATPHAYWVATSGGVLEFDRQSQELLRTYTTHDGLSSLDIKSLSRAERGAVLVHLKDAECELKGSRFSCVSLADVPKRSTATPQRKKTESTNKQAPSVEAILPQYEKNYRITAHLTLEEGELRGTSGGGVSISGMPLTTTSALPGRHVTSLAIFKGKLWVGTFNNGLARENDQGQLADVEATGPGRMINALLTGPTYLYVGTSEGLFRTLDGESFQAVSIVEDAVVGLAFDGTSVWATTPGALYRVRDKAGPPSDVWWAPGGARSLQKVSATQDGVWIASEDRGAIFMKIHKNLVAKDRNFKVFDRSRGLPSSWSLSVGALPQGGALMSSLREGLVRIGKDGSHQVIAADINQWGLTVECDDSGTWVGTQGGALWLPTEGRPQLIFNLPNDHVHAFLRDPRADKGGRVWVGTENGLAWLVPKESR